VLRWAAVRPAEPSAADWTTQYCVLDRRRQAQEGHEPAISGRYAPAMASSPASWPPPDRRWSWRRETGKHTAMLRSRFRLSGLFAVLLALMAQLGAGATVARVDPPAVAGELCHADSEGIPPAHGRSHPSDCLACPLCATLHAQPTLLASAAPAPTPPAVLAIRRSELPPPPIGPPTPHRPPSQPRAPPTAS
jgi:hypothetical protein